MRSQQLSAAILSNSKVWLALLLFVVVVVVRVVVVEKHTCSGPAMGCLLGEFGGKSEPVQSEWTVVPARGRRARRTEKYDGLEDQNGNEKCGEIME